MTATLQEAPRRKKRRDTDPATPNGIPATVTSPHDYVVSTAMLADILEPLLEEKQRRIDGLWGANPGGPGSGAAGWLVQRASALSGASPEALARRLYGIRLCISRTTSADLAENLLSAFDLMIGIDVELPVFPASYRAAREMVDVWAPEMDDDEAEAFARQMYRFTIGFVADNTREPLDPAKHRRNVLAYKNGRCFSAGSDD